jgi:hypothetical protein
MHVDADLRLVVNIEVLKTIYVCAEIEANEGA